MPNSENILPIEKNKLSPDHEVDATGLSCPLPLLKMKQVLNVAKVGEVILVKATDPGSQRDFKAYIQMTKHQMIAEVINKEFVYIITKH
ncbi:sulfurtransferase TusA family protein [Aliikangiella sp. IMCC44359]|uniref:sulfurtransferase TusA family protein n=1 Tax=Aliikangiella sp. IMCC44359 TaxID=3459125 RepID=UPI00403AC993